MSAKLFSDIVVVNFERWGARLQRAVFLVWFGISIIFNLHFNGIHKNDGFLCGQYAQSGQHAAMRTVHHRYRSNLLLPLRLWTWRCRYKYINIIWLGANWLAMSNSCYNPFIYGLLNVRHHRSQQSHANRYPQRQTICTAVLGFVHSASTELTCNKSTQLHDTFIGHARHNFHGWVQRN